MIQETAYAKINLGLEVGAIREDRYHDMNTIMVPIELYDDLYFEQIDEGIILIDNTDIESEDNFVYKAAKLMLKKFNIKKGVRIKLVKRIPSQAGLGGGSSDAAATLRGLNRLFNLNLSLDELADLAKELGSDMPFCVYQTLSYCSGRGEEVKPINICYPHIPLAIVKPPYGLSTKDVYQQGVFDTVDIHKEQFDGIVKAIASSDIKALAKNMFNELETSSFKIEPELLKLKKEIESLGYFCQMTGSGTAFFVLSLDYDFQALQKNLKFNKIFITKMM